MRRRVIFQRFFTTRNFETAVTFQLMISQLRRLLHLIGQTLAFRFHYNQTSVDTFLAKLQSTEVTGPRDQLWRGWLPIFFFAQLHLILPIAMIRESFLLLRRIVWNLWHTNPLYSVSSSRSKLWHFFFLELTKAKSDRKGWTLSWRIRLRYWAKKTSPRDLQDSRILNARRLIIKTLNHGAASSLPRERKPTSRVASSAR